jgi:hypothetical protein
VKKHEVPCSGCRKLSYFDLADKLGKNIALTFIDGITRRTNFIIDENLENGNRVHLIIQKIAENKDKGTIAAKVVLLGYINNQAELKHLEELERIKHERKAYARWQPFREIISACIQSIQRQMPLLSMIRQRNTQG